MTIRKCLNCNQPIPITRIKTAIYCKDTCKARYHEKKQASEIQKNINDNNSNSNNNYESTS